MGVRVLRAAAAIAIGVALLATAPAAEARDAARAERLATIRASELPREGRAVLAAIHAGGPFAFKRDGIVFGNREGSLPRQPRGYYAEYTVPTPGARTRGARRIVAGRGAAGDRTSNEYYYTNDHYQSFRRIVQ